MPIYLWKFRWVRAWRWWQSVLFFGGWFCALIPLIVVVVGQLTGDSQARMDAKTVLVQVLNSSGSIVVVGPPVTVEPSGHSDGSTIDIPYQGEQLDYTIDFRTTTVLGAGAPCRVKLSLSTKAVGRREPPVFGSAVGQCFL
ncbi:hypothetical protein B1964_28690 [Gordonia sp. i37]|nr:hypothetical protein B1964_28690 [Gordonia sp. i37]